MVSGILMHIFTTNGFSSQFTDFHFFMNQVDSPRSPSQAYNAFLAALYSKYCLRVSGRATVIDLMGDSSSSSSSSSSSGGEDGRRSKYFDGEDRVMSES
jgi:hypothetical protein